MTIPDIASLGSISRGLDDPDLTPKLWNNLFTQRGRNGQVPDSIHSSPPFTPAAAPAHVWEESDQLLGNEVFPAHNRLQQTSTYLSGEIGLTVRFLESQWSGCPFEDWQPQAKQLAYGEVVNAAYILDQAGRPGYNTYCTVDSATAVIPWEPIATSITNGDHYCWRAAAMIEGIPCDEALTLSLEYWVNNWIRKTYGLDWASIIYFVDVDCDDDRLFADNYRSFSRYYGPMSTIIYTHGANVEDTIAHELTHTYGALDEYADQLITCGCENSGYLHVPNQNCENCTSVQEDCMMWWSPFELMCPWTQGQLGWQDSDSPPDSIYDVIDHPQSHRRMTMGSVQYPIEVGDFVDVYADPLGTDWVKRIAATERNSSTWTIWDGISYRGTVCSIGQYWYSINNDAGLTSSFLVQDEEGVSIDLAELTDKGDGYHKLRFAFHDLIVPGAMVRVEVRRSPPEPG